MKKKIAILGLLIGIFILSLLSIAYANEGEYSSINSQTSVKAEVYSKSENEKGENTGVDVKGSLNAGVKAEVEAAKKAREKIEEKKNELREKFEDKKEEIRREFKEKIENNEEKLKRLIEFKEKIKKNKGEFRVEGKSVLISEISKEQKEIIAGRINARTKLNLTADDVGNGTLLKAILSNGKFADIKIMPDKAAAVALEKLRAKCEERNCSVELKEVGFGNNTRAAWVVETEKESRVFLIFKKRMITKAEIDPKTGEILRIKKPWWTFLAKEKHATRAEIESEIEGNVTIRKITICHMPPGNADARHTITISEKALKAHLAHGDFVGACEGAGSGGGNYTNVTIPPLNNTGNDTEGNSSLNVNVSANLNVAVGVGA